MALSGSEYEAIELAIKVTGQQGVIDLKTQLATLDGEIKTYQAALAAGLVLNKKELEDLADLSAAYKKTAEQIAAAERVVKGLSAAMEETKANANGASRAILEFSRGFEDLATGGFLGVLNNIPGVFGGIAQAAGAAAPMVAKIEGAAALLSTTAYLLYTNWDKIKKLFDDGLAPKLLDDIKDIEASLKELTEKEWKTRVDIQDIENAKAELEELRKAKRAYEGLGAQSEEERLRGKEVTAAVVEGGGRAAVTRAVLASTIPPETDAQRANREKMEDYNLRVSKLQEAGLVVPTALEQEIEAFKKSKGGREALDMQNRRAAVERQIGQAASGDEIQRKWLQDVFEANQGKFAATGVDLDRFGAGIAGASPDRIQAAQRAKVKAQEDARAVREQTKIDAEAERVRKAQVALKKEAEDAANKDAEEDAKGLLDMNADADRIRKENTRKAKQAADKAKQAADKAANDRLKAEQEAPTLQDRRDIRDLGLETAGRAAFQGYGQMNEAQAIAAGQKALGLIKGGLDPNAAMQKVIFDMAAAVEKAYADIQAQQMGMGMVGQRMQNLGNGVGRARQRGGPLGGLH